MRIRRCSPVREDRAGRMKSSREIEESDEGTYIHGFESEAEAKQEGLGLSVLAPWRDEEERMCLVRL